MSAKRWLSRHKMFNSGTVLLFGLNHLTLLIRRLYGKEKQQRQYVGSKHKLCDCFYHRNIINIILLVNLSTRILDLIKLIYSLPPSKYL